MNLENLNRRIKTTSDLSEIVSTMKMLSSVNVGQFEKALKSLTQYGQTIRDAFHGLFTQESFHYDAPEIPKGKPNVLAIIIGSDNGLVGKFNRELMDFATTYLEEKFSNIHLLTVGKRIALLSNNQNLKIAASFPSPNSVKEIAPMAAQLLNQINDIASHNKIDFVYLLANRKQGNTSFIPQARQIIPLPDANLKQLTCTKWNGRTLPLITADKKELFHALIQEYLIVVISHDLAASLASEHYTRMIHMQEAEKNIEKSLDEFHLEYQQLRQTQITDELIDIISGAEEMNKQKNQSSLDISEKKK